MLGPGEQTMPSETNRKAIRVPKLTNLHDLFPWFLKVRNYYISHVQFLITFFHEAASHLLTRFIHLCIRPFNHMQCFIVLHDIVAQRHNDEQ